MSAIHYYIISGDEMENSSTGVHSIPFSLNSREYNCLSIILCAPQYAPKKLAVETEESIYSMLLFLGDSRIVLVIYQKF